VFSEAVAIGVAAFVDGDAPHSDDDVRERLRRAGVEPWLVERLLVFLPLAFGRRVLPGVELSDEFSDGPRLRPLADEPVFAAAAARAELAVRSEVERIGLRSSEVNAVNEALHKGSRLEDLVCGPPVLGEPLPPPEPGDGGVPSPRAMLLALLAGHGFVPGGPRMGTAVADARVFPMPTGPGRVMVQVDFELRHPAAATGRVLESFAWFGTTWREAIGNCVRRFEQGSLHPMIAGLLDRDAGGDQVGWERYEHPSRVFDLCLGPQLTYFSREPAPPAGPLLDELLAALRAQPLDDTVHALRVFTSYQDGVPTTNEVLLDGEPWAGGEAVVAAAQVSPGTQVGRRFFGLLVPASRAA
jgi:hypothetical protein